MKTNSNVGIYAIYHFRMSPFLLHLNNGKRRSTTDDLAMQISMMKMAESIVNEGNQPTDTRRESK